MDERKVITVFRSYYEAAKQIPDKAAQADFLMAVLAYGFDGEEPETLTGWTKAMFEVVRPNLEAANQKAAAGKKGMAKRWEKQTDNTPITNAYQGDNTAITDPKQTDNTPITIKDKGQGIKDKGQGITPQKPPKGAQNAQPKVQWAEFVTMTNAEHDKLLAAYGPADTARLIEILDNYKGSKGATYKSDYRAILNWVVPRLQEEKAKKAPPQEPKRWSNVAVQMAAEMEGGHDNH